MSARERFPTLADMAISERWIWKSPIPAKYTESRDALDLIDALEAELAALRVGRAGSPDVG